MIYWTRGKDDWEADRQLFASKILTRVVNLPCLRTQPMPSKRPEGQWPNLAITSQKVAIYAAENAAVRGCLAEARAIYVFGTKTRQALIDLGFAPIHVRAAGSARELGAYLVASLKEKERLLTIGAEFPAFDLVAMLRSVGLIAAHWPIYQTIASLELEPGFQSKNMAGVLCLASPSAVSGFVRTVNELPEAVKILTIGETTAVAAREAFGREVLVARRADLQTLASAATELLLDDGTLIHCKAKA